MDPDARGQGAGRFLVAHAQQLAGGPLAVDVNEQNEAGAGLLRGAGIAVVGQSPTDRGGRPFALGHMRREAR